VCARKKGKRNDVIANSFGLLRPFGYW